MERVKRMEVSGLLSPIVLVSPISPISNVIGVLKKSNTYEAFLEDKGKIGMITTRDILRASNVTKAKASSIAIPIPKISLRSTIEEAARLMMNYRIRTLPIIDHNDIIGGVQALSIINAIKGSTFSKVIAQDIMTRTPATLSSDDLVSKARGLMIRRKIDHIPAMVGTRLCGVLTSSHIVFNMIQVTETIERSTTISEEQKKLEFPLRYIVDSNPLTCGPNDYLSSILDAMIRESATCTIVTLFDEIQGIITYRDFMKLVTEQLKVGEVPIYVLGLPEDPLKAAMVQSKFSKAVKTLRKRFPFVEEGKAVIKTFSKGEKERRRYEVKVSIITPKRTFSYSEEGWELSNIFDAIADKLKNIMLQKRLRGFSPES